MDNQPTNPLESLLQMLMGQMRSRPDLGQNSPVGTMAGRVVGPGDTIGSALSRMPMGTGEGDQLTATLQAAMGPMAQGASSALAAKLIPLLAGGIAGGRGMAPSRPVINPSMQGSSMPPTDPWGPQRQAPMRGQSAPPQAPGFAMSRNPDGSIALPHNPHDAHMTPQQQGEYNRLPAGGRSQGVPEDLRRRGMGETTAPLGDVPRSGMVSDRGLSFFRQLADALGIPVQ